MTKKPESLSLFLPLVHILLFLTWTVGPFASGGCFICERLDVTQTNTDDLKSHWRRDYVSISDILQIFLKTVGHQPTLPPSKSKPSPKFR